MKNRPTMEHGGERQYIMGYRYKEEAHPKPPRTGGEEYAEWRRKYYENPVQLVTVEIEFPTYYWRARYPKQGTQYEYIPKPEIVAGKFINMLDLQLADGRILHGTWQDDMGAEQIEKNAAILRAEAAQIESEEAGARGEAIKQLERKIDGVETAQQENARLLHRVNRKVDGVPPLLQKVKEINRPLSEGAAKLLQKVRLSPQLWDTYTDHWQNGKTQTQIAVDRGLPKKDAYKINRECKAIEKAFQDAREPIPDKLTRHNAEIAPDGEIVKKQPKKPHSWV